MKQRILIENIEIVMKVIKVRSPQEFEMCSSNLSLPVDHDDVLGLLVVRGADGPPLQVRLPPLLVHLVGGDTARPPAPGHVACAAPQIRRGQHHLHTQFHQQCQWVLKLSTCQSKNNNVNQ